MDVAREVPSHEITVVSDTRVVGGSNNSSTSLVDFLKQETEVRTASHPLVHVQGVLSSIEYTFDGGMLESAEIIIVSVNNNRVAPDFSTFDSKRLDPTDGLSESKSDETDDRHDGKDDRDNSDLFSPCSLSFGCSFSCARLERPIGDTDGQKVTVDHPGGFGTGYEITEAWTAVGFVLARVDLVDGGGLGWFVGLGFTSSQGTSS